MQDIHLEDYLTENQLDCLTKVAYSDLVSGVEGVAPDLFSHLEKLGHDTYMSNMENGLIAVGLLTLNEVSN